jgi:cobalt/nickel transport system permease protein
MLKETVFYIGSFPVTEGMLSFTSILYRTFLAVLAALSLIATTPFPDFIRQLGRMGVPWIFCLQTMMTWRYVTVLISEAGTMYTAYLLRSGGRKGIGMKDMGSFLGVLLLRSVDRADRVYRAMKSRGFDGGCRNTGAARGIRPPEYLFAVTACAVMMFFRFFDAGNFLGRIIMRLAGR